MRSGRCEEECPGCGGVIVIPNVEECARRGKWIRCPRPECVVVLRIWRIGDFIYETIG